MAGHLVGLAETTAAFLATLTIVVFVHELGHFLLARWNGVKVEVFSIGFGRELFGWTDRCGTRWRIGLLPLGGYVRFMGDADAASSRSNEAALSEEELRHAFASKSRGRKAAVVLAGPASNFLFAVLIFFGLFSLVGQRETQAVIGAVVPGSPAALAGLEPGDRILSLAGRKIERFEDVQRWVLFHGVRPMEIVVERAGATMTATTQPQFRDVQDSQGRVEKTPFLGVAADRSLVDYKRLSVLESAKAAASEVGALVSGTLVAVGQMIAGDRGTEGLAGPLGIAQTAGEAAGLGVSVFLRFVALLSVNLGLINLFPIPLLDGGHLLFYAIEALIGRPLNERMRELASAVGFVFVLALMAFATWNDAMRWMGG